MDSIIVEGGMISRNELKILISRKLMAINRSVA